MDVETVCTDVKTVCIFACGIIDNTTWILSKTVI